MPAASEVRPPPPSASAAPASEAGGGLGGRGRLSGSSKLSESRPAARWLGEFCYYYYYYYIIGFREQGGGKGPCAETLYR